MDEWKPTDPIVGEGTAVAEEEWEPSDPIVSAPAAPAPRPRETPAETGKRARDTLQFAKDFGLLLEDGERAVVLTERGMTPEAARRQIELTTPVPQTAHKAAVDALVAESGRMAPIIGNGNAMELTRKRMDFIEAVHSASQTYRLPPDQRWSAYNKAMDVVDSAAKTLREGELVVLRDKPLEMWDQVGQGFAPIFQQYVHEELGLGPRYALSRRAKSVAEGVAEMPYWARAMIGVEMSAADGFTFGTLGLMSSIGTQARDEMLAKMAAAFNAIDETTPGWSRFVGGMTGYAISPLGPIGGAAARGIAAAGGKELAEAGSMTAIREVGKREGFRAALKLAYAGFPEEATAWGGIIAAQSAASAYATNPNITPEDLAKATLFGAAQGVLLQGVAPGVKLVGAQLTGLDSVQAWLNTHAPGTLTERERLIQDFAARTGQEPAAIARSLDDMMANLGKRELPPEMQQAVKVLSSPPKPAEAPRMPAEPRTAPEVAPGVKPEAVVPAIPAVEPARAAMQEYNQRLTMTMATRGDVGVKALLKEISKRYGVTPDQMIAAGAEAKAAPEAKPETTSIKKAIMEAERVARGAEPLPKPTPETQRQWLDEAKKRVEADPELPQRLIQKLREEPQALDQVEIAVLQNHRRSLKNAYQEATDNLFSAAERGDDAAKATAQAVADAYDAKLNELDVATQVAGTVWGRTGVARQIELAQDYSLAGMVRKQQAAKGGKRLTDAELMKIKAEHERLATVEAALVEREKAVAAREEAAKTTRVTKRIEELSLAKSKSTTLRPTSPRFGETNRVFTRSQHDVALASFRSKMGRLTVGVDVEAIADLTKIGGFYFEGGIRKFEIWAEEMAKELGELAMKARPYFGQVWKEIHAKRLDEMQQRIAAKYARATAAGKEPRGLTSDIQELFTIFIARGLSRDAAVDATHDFLTTLEKTISRRETMDAISGYGKWRFLDKDALKAEVRQNQGELQELAKLEDMAEGRAPAKTGFERQSPSDARRELIKKVNDAKRQGGYNIPDPETQLKSAVQSLRTRWENEITDLMAKIEAGDFAKPPKREPIALDKEMLELKFERDRIKKEFNEGNFKLRMAQRTVLQKIVGLGQEALNLPRAIKSSFDLSALLRQNLITSVSHPIRTLKKTVPAMFRGVTKRGEHKIDLEITERPNFPNYVRDGLNLTEHGTSLAKMEEMFMSRYAEKIPGVAASQRAYTTTLNISRADSYDVLAATLAKGRTLTPAEGKIIANFVNVVTGRGGGGKYGSALTGLNSVFFAPRNLISRFEFLIGQPLWHGILSGKVPLRGTVKVRLLIAGEYARFLIGMAVIYGLAEAAGLEIGYDPRKSTFGKIRVGKTLLDPLAGLSQATVFLSRLITGEKVTVTGKTIALRGEKTTYGAGDMLDVIGDFVRSKLSPVFGAGVSVTAGKTYIGEPMTPASTAADLFMPMAPLDIYETMKANGVPEATILSILAFFGASLQTYDEKERRANP